MTALVLIIAILGEMGPMWVLTLCAVALTIALICRR